ncbi:MAG: iron-sulfur cluster assembly accessory protein [Verrucomicrobia bacterium]|nr:iron-sulfur cluster assembly accessory protein [Verrucomicrobiota bacterium]
MNAIAPVVTVTETAARQILSMQSENADYAGKPLRIYVQEGGCSGLQYEMTFDEQREADLAHQFFGVGVVVDPASAEFVKGAVIDFSDALTGGGFKITNPNARSSCGCGRSFEA